MILNEKAFQTVLETATKAAGADAKMIERIQRAEKNLRNLYWRLEGETFKAQSGSRKNLPLHETTATGCSCEAGAEKMLCWHRVARRMAQLYTAECAAGNVPAVATVVRYTGTGNLLKLVA